MADFKYFKAGSIYVDAAIGNDANPGTIGSPKQTIEAAVNIAPANALIIVGTGKYNYKEPSIVQTNVTIIGDGFVLLDGTGLANGSGASKISRIKNLNFYNYKGTMSALSFETLLNQRDMKVQCCGFWDCEIENSRNTFDYIKDSIFQNCVFDSQITSQELQNAIHNCSFISCDGQLGNALVMEYGVFNNTYTDCETLSHTELSGSAPESIPIDKFNYNNIDGEFMYGTQTEIKALGTNINGSDHISTDIFNDYDNTRPLIEWWKQSYTQKLTSPVLTSGRNGVHIGRYYKAYHINAQGLENIAEDYIDLQVTDEYMHVIPPGNLGEIVTSEFITGNESLNKLIVNMENAYDVNGGINGYIYNRDNVPPNEKSSSNAGFTLSNQYTSQGSAPSNVPYSFDNYWYLILGRKQDNTLIGTADEGYIDAAQTLNRFNSLKNNDITIDFNFTTP